MRHFSLAALCGLLALPACSVLESVGLAPSSTPSSNLDILLPYGASSREACLRPGGLRYRELDVSRPVTLAAREAGFDEPPAEAPVLVVRLAAEEGTFFPAGDRVGVRLVPKDRFAPFLAVARPVEFDGKLYYRHTVAPPTEGFEQQLEVAAPLEAWVSALEGSGCFTLELTRAR